MLNIVAHSLLYVVTQFGGLMDWKKKKILILDDSKSDRVKLSWIISTSDEMNRFEIFEAENTREALEILTLYKINLAFLDINLHESDPKDGIEFIENCRAKDPM